ncbi:uncharacterized protein ACHE_40617A [Aspergillus chevalieri]|uniref:Uncharacterized protein n=1 Tax=Aspergillus chevalieri TaxID=182096 RepID=A0A7R7ZN03_ASPCH|nr:uncharacterized protein ACHE_40617A [Aspergillus chevalieri]BCR88053.1 hypothetical protein ACHE_40617A [Aspergillus chevalieri]
MDVDVGVVVDVDVDMVVVVGVEYKEDKDEEYKESREEVNLLGEKSLDNGVYERVTGEGVEQ